MNQDNMNFPIPNSVLEPYIKQAVSTSIVSVLGDGTRLIEEAVQAALSHKVDINGEVSNYRSDNKYDVVEILARNRIKEITSEVIKEMAENIRPSIEKKVRDLILKRKDDIAHTLVKGMIDSLSCSWNMHVDIKPPKPNY